MSNIVIANDHGAVELKQRLLKFLESEGHKVIDLGVDTEQSVDYPDIARSACLKYLEGNIDFGILLCGTGIGISIAANKIKGIRCALTQDSFSARLAREHNNANFLAFGGRVKYNEPVENILKAFMEAQFQAGRHQTRIDKMTKLESNSN